MSLRGAICFSTHRDKPLSKIIRWYTGHRFSHTFMITDVVDDRAYILEAGLREVSFGLLSEYDDKNTEYEVWVPNEPNQEEISEAIRRTTRVFLRKKYSYGKLAGIVLTTEIQKYFGKILSNPMKMGAICSEVQWYYLSQIYPAVVDGLDHTKVRAEDLRDKIIQSGLFTLRKFKAFDE